MTKRKASAPSDYPVGYGRPPKETRFQPGKSGNPAGRRKGSRTVGAILTDIIRAKDRRDGKWQDPSDACA